MMKLNDADLQLLEDFWYGKLSDVKRQEMEKRLKQDAAFAAAAAEWQLLVEQASIPTQEEAKEAAQIKSRLQHYAEEATSAIAVDKVEVIEKTARFRPLYFFLSAAAAIALILLWLTINDSFVEENLGTQYFTHLSRDNANLSPDIENGEDAYDQKEYALAYTLLMEDVAAGSDSLNLIYASVAAIGSQQADKAIAILEPLVDNESWQFYQSEIQWYLALAYLQVGEVGEAMELLEVIVGVNGEYANEARKLLAQITEN